MLLSACYSGLVALGVPSLVRRLRPAGVLLCYHNVLPPRNATAAGDAGVHMPFERFAEQVHWLARRYAVVALREFVERLRAGRSLRGVAALTFDDGYDGVFQHAWPHLSKLGVPATVFVVATAPDQGRGFWWDHPAVAQRTPAPREHGSRSTVHRHSQRRGGQRADRADHHLGEQCAQRGVGERQRARSEEHTSELQSQ